MSLQVDREILFYAFRYALGRSSIAPSNVADTVKKNIDELNTGTIRAFIKEIQECDDHDGFGMEMDRWLWWDLRSFLREELDKREQCL